MKTIQANGLASTEYYLMNFKCTYLKFITFKKTKLTNVKTYLKKVGFEPTTENSNRFTIYRYNHSATFSKSIKFCNKILIKIIPLKDSFAL